ncbi:hypothetical protein GCM10007079_48440 [Nocardiopsis terrae]|uniref:Uncharacterized protein n=1 Tax=Nocardiopsis terrae TaxID=372655 RepID=A0ABR9HAI2_9ACTN|nr:hypothetical protein [Nocardiopsis terrae]MBE1456040.1 hypothetical protein [Nocardiopsis terrae]GHC96184.1 hypothetical protein GCM10007079_48440 [Nocardiopsis terrae]
MNVVVILGWLELALGVGALSWMVWHARNGRSPAQQRGFRPLMAVIAVISVLFVITLVI